MNRIPLAKGETVQKDKPNGVTLPGSCSRGSSRDQLGGGVGRPWEERGEQTVRERMKNRYQRWSLEGHKVAGNVYF